MKIEVLSGGQRGEVFSVAHEAVRIGAEAGNHVLLRDREVSREHAELRKKGDSWYLIDLGSLNGVTVNGKKISAKTEIFDGDRISFGPVEVLVHGARRGGTAPMTTRRNLAHEAQEVGGFYLQGAGSNAGSRYSLSKHRVTVGRNAENDIVIPETTISMQHAVFENDGNHVTLVDQESTNGTFVNGYRITRRVLKSGDTVRFDEFEYVYTGAGDTIARTTPRLESAGVDTEPRSHPDAQPLEPAMAFQGRETTTVPGRHRWESEGVNGKPWLHIAGVTAVVLAAVVAGLLIKDRRATGEPMEASAVSQPSEQIAPSPAFPAPSVEADEIDAAPAAPVPNAEAAEVPAAPSATDYSADDQVLDRLILSQSYSVDLPGPISAPVATADLTGDGTPDLLAASSGGAFAGIDGNNGEVLFRAYEPRTFLSEPVVCDVDGDGASEVVLTTEQGEVFLFHRSGRVLWQSRSETGGRPLRAAAAIDEFTGDGVLDIVVSDESGTVIVLNGKTGFFERKSKRLKGPFLSAPVIGPIDEHGYPSIIVASKSGMVYRLFGKTMNKIWECDVDAPITTTPILMDFNGDGMDDVIVACSDWYGTISVIDGINGRELWRHQVDSRITASPKLMNSDSGQPVLICCAENGVVAVALDRRAPLWHYDNPGAEAIRSRPALHDVNADGQADILIAVPGVGLVVLDGHDGGELSRFSTGADILAEAILADFDGDGNLDIAVTDQSGTVTVITTNRHVRRSAVVS